MRNSVLSPGVAFFGKNTALRAGSTSNSGMENPNLRTEVLFHINIYVNREPKSERNLYNATFFLPAAGSPDLIPKIQKSTFLFFSTPNPQIRNP
jgi:hypothetical protein